METNEETSFLAQVRVHRTNNLKAVGWNPVVG